MREGPILVVQRQPQSAEAHVRDVLQPGTVLQTANQLETLLSAAGQGVNPGAKPLHADIPYLAHLVELSERLGVIALECVTPDPELPYVFDPAVTVWTQTAGF